MQVADVKLIDNSAQIKAMSKQAIEKALTEIGMTCETHAKKLCPVDTGNLRNSISYQVNASGNYVDIGTDVFYGKFVELSTRYMKAQPFLKPAATEHTSEYKAIVEKHLKNG